MIQAANRLTEVEEYYFSRKLEEIAHLKTDIPVLSLAIGSPDLQPHPSVIESLILHAQQGNNQYQSYRGLDDLRKAMADFYWAKFDVFCDHTTEILPLMGSKEGIMHISMAFLNEGDSVLIPNPGYPTYSSVTKLLRAKPIYYDLNETKNWQPDFEQLERLAQQKPKIMWINYPHMPTGANAIDETFERLILFAKKHQILLVNDNPYSLILNPNPKSIFNFEGAKDVALELNSLSKTFNIAGWRIGMLVGNETLLKTVLKVKTNMDSGMYYALQKAAATALRLDNLWYKQLNSTYEYRRELVQEIATKLDLSFAENSCGMFVWAKIKHQENDYEFVDRLLHDKKIFITPGSIFGSNGAGYVRLSLCVPEAQLEEINNRINNK